MWKNISHLTIMRGSFDPSMPFQYGSRLIVASESSEHARPSLQGRFQLGIVTMTKRPENFFTWLEYHLQYASHFFLRVEDTPALEHLLAQSPHKDRCTVTSAASTIRDWSGQTERQMTHVRKSLTGATAKGCTHLLHIDDDELLYLPGGLSLLQVAALSARPDVVDIHMLNLEALAPGIDCRNPFAECCAFRHDPSTYCAYGAGPSSRGKSMGVLSHTSVAPMGPHHFTAYTKEPTDELSLVLPPPVAVILHYESCKYTRWRDKFTDYATRQLQEGAAALGLGKTFSPFYSKSVVACAQLQTMRGEDAAAMELLGHVGAPDAEALAKDTWSSGKLEPAEATRLRPIESVHILGAERVTLMPPPAAAVAARPEVERAERSLEAAMAANALPGAPTRQLEVPRSRRWKVVHTKAILIREAPSVDAPMLDLVLPGSEVEADAQTANGTWLRLAKVFDHGRSGWALVDATSLGYNVLLEPVHIGTPQPSKTETERVAGCRPATESGAAVVAARPGAMTVEQLVERAKLPEEYISLLKSAGLPAASSPSGGYGSDAVEDAARKAKLPLGHRLRLKGLVSTLE